jgi:hypothetical protein
MTDRTAHAVLFCRERREREIWDGFRMAPAPREIFGFDEAHPIGALREALPDMASAPRCTRRSACSATGTAKSPTC